MKWIKTDKHVYGAIYREHHESFMVFGSFSNPTPSEIQFKCEMLTEWGFKGADFPLIKCVNRWDHEDRKGTETWDFFIACPKKDDE